MKPTTFPTKKEFLNFIQHFKGELIIKFKQAYHKGNLVATYIKPKQND